MSDASVSSLITSLKQGDGSAAEQLWDRYFDRLVSLARRRLSTFPKRAWDEEDVALSVFDSLCRGARHGNFQSLADRDDLWALLLTLTHHKIVDRQRYEGRKKRGAGRVRAESALANRADETGLGGLEQLMADEPSPDSLVALREQYGQLMELLPDDTWRRVVILRMEGYKVKEIAADFGRTTRWVERKLELIRERWLRQLAVEDSHR